MTQVETVRGPIDVTSLGARLMHEHVFVLNESTAGNYTYIHDHVLPALTERGVTAEQIDSMLVANPRRYFTAAP